MERDKKPRPVEASTLFRGEYVEIPGEAKTYRVVSSPSWDKKVQLQTPCGQRRSIASSDFVYLRDDYGAGQGAQETKPAAPGCPQAAHLQPLWYKFKTGTERISAHMTTHIVRLPLISLDPRLAAVPMMRDVAARFLGAAKPEHKRTGQEIAEENDALWASLDRDGIIEPIKAYRVGRKWVTADGRHRLEWANARSIAKVPLIEISESQAAAIIEGTVMGRRHWTKGQRAYMGVMLHPEVCGVTKGRPEKSDSIGIIANATELAKRLGISADTVSQACELYRLFFSPGSKPGSPEAIEAAAKKAKYEMSIWAGAGLGAVLAGIGGGKSTEDQPRADSGFHGLDKPLGTFTRFSSLFTNWTPEEQGKAQQLMTAKFRAMSPEFRLALSESLAAAEI